MNRHIRGLRSTGAMWRMLATLTLVVTGLSAVFSPATAQGGTSNVAIVTTENGQSVYDACFVIAGHSNEGCDENRDGKITFQDIPIGTHTLSQTRNLGAGRTVPDQVITVTGAMDSDGWERFYVTVGSSGSGGQGRVSDVAVVATENGVAVFDACFVLVDFSNEGCDENRDGKITFQDVPLGTYILRQTRDLGPGRSIPDTTIGVTGIADSDGWERFRISVLSSGTSSGGYGGMVIGATACDDGRSCWNEIGARFTVTTEGGEFLGSCTVTGNRHDTSHVAACVVDFLFRPMGNVVVTLDTSSITPGYVPEENPIRVDLAGLGRASYDVIFHVRPGSSGQSGAVDIALITRAPEDGQLLTGTCYVLVGYSNVGCDENGDGQVTFADIPFGTYTVRQTQTPAGYSTINDYEIAVQPPGYMEGPVSAVPLGFVVRQAPEQNAPNTRNVSVVMLNMSTMEKVDSLCVELVGASNIGCDEDLIDGQIDFLDVPAGGPYELRFSNLPSGYQIVTMSGPLLAIVDADPGDPANLFLFVLVVVP